MKIIFMGTPDFAAPTLEALLKSQHQILAVYTQPPRPAGRGHKEQKSPIHTIAEHHNISIKTPKTLKDTDTQSEFKKFNTDAAIISAYGLIIPETILNSCPCINVHASLLPRWRGAAPIQHAILSGDTESGITIMMMDKGLDTGDIIMSKSTPITPTMTSGQLHDQLSNMGSQLILDTLDLLQTNKLKQTKQPPNSTYANKITKEEAQINWHDEIQIIDRKIRGYNPYPGAFFIYNSEKIKVLTANLITTNTNQPPGTVIDNNLSIAAINGIIQPTTIQRPNKKIMPTSEMLRGYPIKTGTLIS